MQRKPSLMKDPAFWDHTTRWILFRGDPLRTIKNKLYEQDAAVEMAPQSEAVVGLSAVLDSDQTSPQGHLAATLHHLIELALRLDDVATANTIYDEFYPAMGLSPSSLTDELRLQALLQIHEARAAKSLYDNLRLEGHRLPADIVVRLIQELGAGDQPFQVEAQAVFFDLIDTREAPDEALSSSFALLSSLLLRIGDFPRLRQTLQDRNIDRVPNWQKTLSTIALDLLSDPKMIWLEQLLPIYHIAQRWTTDSITLSHRHSLMHKLISLGRTDLGLELFHDMRLSDISQPTSETYLIMLSGCAKTKDTRTLEHIHSALRLDSSVEPDTSIFNALMLAYNRTHLPEKALAIWEVLSQSAKLPDVETASLALGACASLPRYGLIRAREIWTFMEHNKMRPTSSSYAALLEVFASVGKWDGIIGLLERMNRDQVDALVLGTAYNAMMRDRKAEVESWGKANKPGVWRYLETLSAQKQWRTS
jgi:PPR repeat